jgi:hypothetical protein
MREKGMEDLGRIAKIHRILNKGLKHKKGLKRNAKNKHP